MPLLTPIWIPQHWLTLCTVYTCRREITIYFFTTFSFELNSAAYLIQSLGCCSTKKCKLPETFLFKNAMLSHSSFTFNLWKRRKYDPNRSMWIPHSLRAVLTYFWSKYRHNRTFNIFSLSKLWFLIKNGIVVIDHNFLELYTQFFQKRYKHFFPLRWEEHLNNKRIILLALKKPLFRFW